VRLKYRANNGRLYPHLIDTPGLVDFAYKCRFAGRLRGLAAVVDASQGVEAQTLANVYQAIKHNHEIVVVLNKVDLPAAEPERIREQCRGSHRHRASNAVLISGQTGLGIPDVLKPSSTNCRRRARRLRQPLEGDAGPTAGTTPTRRQSSWCASSTAC